MARKSRWLSKKTVLVLSALLVTAAVLILILELTNTTHLFHSVKAKSGTIPTITTSVKTSKNNAVAPTNQSSPSVSSKNNQIGAPAQASSSSQPPIAPYGAFVSDHSPNLSGSPHPSLEQSTCYTTPGASCYIQFTQNNVVKTLSSQTADSNGLVSWTWDVNQAGLTQGNWQITAVSSLNNQTKSSTDNIGLMVGP